MKRFCLVLAGVVVLPPLSWADGASADRDRSDCGGDAYTFAEVVSAPRSAEPLIAVPGTLCADLVNRHPTGINSLNIYVDGTGNTDAPGGNVPTGNAPRRRH